jgi:hypothetical protein
MKKRIGLYSIIWFVCLALFNVIVFITPNEIGGVSKFSNSFWIGYAFITVAFIGQLACALLALKARKRNKIFYNASLFFVSYGGLIAMLIAGGIFMATPSLPAWIGIIVCSVILIANIVAVISTKSVIDTVSEIDERVASQTYFIKNLSNDAKALMAAAASEELRAEAKRVYEAIRYSDPKSGASTAELNLQIEREFNGFADAIRNEDIDLARASALTVIELTKKRNYTSRLAKND